MNELLTTEGRIPRSTFWNFYGAVIGGLALAVLLMILLPESLDWVVALVLGPVLFAIAFVSLFVQIKRWHDRDKSGWWILINLVPVVGAVWAFVECGLLRGTEGPNQFGYDPLEEFG